MKINLQLEFHVTLYPNGLKITNIILLTKLAIDIISKVIFNTNCNVDILSTSAFQTSSIGEPVYYELFRQQDLYIMDIRMLNEHQELR